MNTEQRTMVKTVLVILGCFGIIVYTFNLPVHHYCDWTGREIVDPLAHEVTFEFDNGTVRHYCCINVSLLAFEHILQTEGIEHLRNIQVRCVMCGMLMDWNDPMVVWVYQVQYLCPTTGTPTIVAVCRDSDNAALCESHFLELYGGEMIDCPFEWP